MSERNPIIIETGDKSQIDAAIIWLHGLGADGSDFVPIINELRLPQDAAYRFIFPNAPVMPVTINQGYRMPAWYDVRSLSIVDGEDQLGIEQSSRYLAGLCHEQIAAGIDSRRIIVAGFSQGGAIALHCGCRFELPLGGIMALSTYLPLPDLLQPEMNDQILSASVFMAHGRQDDVIALRNAKHSCALLQDCGIKVLWHEYDMPHSVCPQEITDIKQWLIDIL
jgi:phospholipase/carboxylesterase